MQVTGEAAFYTIASPNMFQYMHNSVIVQGSSDWQQVHTVLEYDAGGYPPTKIPVDPVTVFFAISFALLSPATIKVDNITVEEVLFLTCTGASFNTAAEWWDLGAQT
eukprot:1624534-Rhodomonas_salina.1